MLCGIRACYLMLLLIPYGFLEFFELSEIAQQEVIILVSCLAQVLLHIEHMYCGT